MARGAKRSVIAEAALRLFLEAGFAATSVDVIAREAGVSKPTIYNYFPDKEALFEHAATQAIFSVAALWSAPPPSGKSPRSQLLQFATRCVEFCNDDTLVALMRLAIAESTRFPTVANGVLEAIWRPLEVALLHMLEPRLGRERAAEAAKEFLCRLRGETILPRLFGWRKAPTARQRRALAVSVVDRFLRLHGS